MPTDDPVNRDSDASGNADVRESASRSATQRRPAARIESVAATLEAPLAAAADAGDDAWFAWLRHTRHGGDAGYAARLGQTIEAIRDRVLDRAALAPDRDVADVGCGDGLAGFAVLERQPACRVTFVDISPALISSARARARSMGIEERCRFIVAPAETLAPLADSCVDVVLVRAMLAYVADKAAAVRAFRRILRPGGRISLVDPIFQDGAFEVAGMARALRSEAGTAGAAALEYMHRLRSAYLPDSLEAIGRSPLTNYNERDLVRLFEVAGFTNIHLRLHIDCVPALPMPWQAYLASSPRAGTPTVADVLQSRFSGAERRALESMLRPIVEAGSHVERNVNAYIFADA